MGLHAQVQAQQLAAVVVAEAVEVEQPSAHRRAVAQVDVVVDLAPVEAGLAVRPQAHRMGGQQTVAVFELDEARSVDRGLQVRAVMVERVPQADRRVEAPGPQCQAVVEGIAHLGAFGLEFAAAIGTVFENDFHQRLDAAAELRRQVKVQRADAETAQPSRVAHAGPAGVCIGEAMQRHTGVADVAAQALGNLFDALLQGIERLGLIGARRCARFSFRSSRCRGAFEFGDAFRQLLDLPQAGVELVFQRTYAFGVHLGECRCAQACPQAAEHQCGSEVGECDWPGHCRSSSRGGSRQVAGSICSLRAAVLGGLKRP